jgi:hypothetical protein
MEAILGAVARMGRAFAPARGQGEPSWSSLGMLPPQQTASIMRISFAAADLTLPAPDYCGARQGDLEFTVPPFDAFVLDSSPEFTR